MLTLPLQEYDPVLTAFLTSPDRVFASFCGIMFQITYALYNSEIQCIRYQKSVELRKIMSGIFFFCFIYIHMSARQKHDMQL